MNNFDVENMLDSKDLSCVELDEDNRKLYYSENNELFEY
jgi:hypothetical protein